MDPILLIPLAISLLALGIAVVTGRQSVPRTVSRLASEARDSAEEAAMRAESVERKWTQLLADFAAIEEAVDGALGSIEKKRRRIAAAESKSPANGGALAETGNDRDALRRFARNAGHRV